MQYYVVVCKATYSMQHYVVVLIASRKMQHFVVVLKASPFQCSTLLLPNCVCVKQLAADSSHHVYVSI
jgi:hypothetical protein